MSTYSINFINKYKAGCISLGLLKQVSDPGSTHTYKHLHKLAPTNRIEWHPGFSRDGFGQQSLTSSWWAYKEHSSWDASPQCLEFLGRLEEFYYFLDFLFSLVCSGNIGKSHIGPLVESQSGAALAEIEGLCSGTTSGTEE